MAASTSTSAPVRSAREHQQEALPLSYSKGYLYLVAFVCGAAVMIIEIVGARRLIPFLGTSHYVWTAQISVTLLAMAAGYWIGGRLSVRLRSPRGFFVAIIGGSLYLAFSTYFTEDVALWSHGMSAPAGSFLVSLFLFFPCIMAFSMALPWLSRLVAERLTDVGPIVGRLAALGTAGSIVGTLLISYVLIPAVSNSTMLLGTAFGLTAVSLPGAFLSDRRGRICAVALLILIGAALLLLSLFPRQRQFQTATELFHADTFSGLVQVLESHSGEWRLLMTDYLVQNQYDPRQQQSMSEFSYVMQSLVRHYSDRLEQVLCIGLGAGILPRQLAAEGIQVDVVEINPLILSVAREFFDFEESPRTHVFIDDGRRYLRSNTRRYDAILIDAFSGDTAPEHLMTVEAFSEAARSLADDGILILNTFADFQSPRHSYSSALEATLTSVFPSVRSHGLEDTDSSVFYVASRTPLRDPPVSIDTEGVHPACRDAVEAIVLGIRPLSPSSPPFRDDGNRALYLDALNRQQLRRHFVSLIDEL
jgi:spermidine synthase